MARILVIDDDPGYQAAMKRVLLLEGHEVRVASDGEEGLALLAQAPSDLVVVDLFMPVMDGIQTIRMIGTRFGNIPILAVSGADRPSADGALHAAMLLGADGTLSKPFDDAEFLRVIHGMLGTGDT